MEAELHIVRDVRVAVFRQAALDGRVSLEAPSLDGVERDDLHDCAERSSCGLFRVPSIAKVIASQRLLESIDGRVGHIGLRLTVCKPLAADGGCWNVRVT